MISTPRTSDLVSLKELIVAAYVVVDIVVKDPVRCDDYRKRAIATLEPYGRKFLVRGGKVETQEGTWKPLRFKVRSAPTKTKDAPKADAHCANAIGVWSRITEFHSEQLPSSGIHPACMNVCPWLWAMGNSYRP